MFEEGYKRAMKVGKERPRNKSVKKGIAEVSILLIPPGFRVGI